MFLQELSYVTAIEHAALRVSLMLQSWSVIGVFCRWCDQEAATAEPQSMQNSLHFDFPVFTEQDGYVPQIVWIDVFICI